MGAKAAKQAEEKLQEARPAKEAMAAEHQQHQAVSLALKQPRSQILYLKRNAHWAHAAVPEFGTLHSSRLHACSMM